jgi:hypothetical protein
MPLTPRQVVVRARETAALLVRALDQERLVPRFVDAYAVQYSRPCCTAYPGQYLETAALLRREALLAMAIWMESEAPRFLGLTKRVAIRKASPKAQTRGKTKKSSAKKIPATLGSAAPSPLTVQFLEEFFTTLVEAQQWSAEEVLQFRADLSLYRRLSSQYANAAQPRRFATSRKLAGVVGGPFVDRCGVLLDPSMFDEARRASARFEEQLRLRAGTIVKSVFGRRRY